MRGIDYRHIRIAVLVAAVAGAATFSASAGDASGDANQACEEYLLNHLNDAEWEQACLDALNAAAAERSATVDSSAGSSHQDAQRAEDLSVNNNPDDALLSQHDLLVNRAQDRVPWEDPRPHVVDGDPSHRR